MLCDQIVREDWVTKEDLDRVEALNPFGPYNNPPKDMEDEEGWLTKQKTMDPREVRRISDGIKAYHETLRKYLESPMTLMFDTMGSGDKAFVKGEVARAKKFILADGFVATQLSGMMTADALEKAKQWFKLPYGVTWVEWGFGEQLPGRFGALFYTPNERAQEKALLVGRFKSKGYSGHTLYILPVAFESQSLMWDEQTGRTRVKSGLMTLAGNPDGRVGQMVMNEQVSSFAEGIDRYAGKYDLEAIINIHLCTAVDAVIRINSPAITEVRPPEEHAVRKAERLERQGKRPLFTYHTVDLRPELKRALREAGSEEVTAQGHVRLHWRRGHFKARKTGIFWWNPHTAGRAELGAVEKDYSVIPTTTTREGD